jgi:hypothetical protein
MAKPRLRDQLTADQLRELLHYDPDTGLFRWREDIDHWRAGLPAGTEMRQSQRDTRYIVLGIGTTSERRYAYIGIRKAVHRAHRLAWLYVYGEWPARELDHINGDGCDNRIVNLRLATASENMRNRRRRSDNTSGFKGVSWSKRSGRWIAHIGINRKIIHLGLFDTKEAAAAAYAEAAARLHGKFANLG